MSTGDEGATRAFADLQIAGYDRAVEIGHGGFAVVYRARRIAFAQDVAIKVLTRSIDANAAGRFDRERQVLGSLAQHPNIVTVYDSGTTPDGLPFLVMEFLPGGPLSAQLKQGGPLDVRRVADIAVKLCGALETAHRTGILHRDIKPDNVLLSRYGEPVLADFGIARMRGALQTESGVVTATLTHAPPEVLDGHAPSPQSDVYSLASTLFALVSGSAPFVRETDPSITPMLARVFRDPVPDLRPRGIPDDFCSLLESAMSKEPGGRPRSALEFGRAIQELQRRNGAPVSSLVVEQVEGEVDDGDPNATRQGPVGPIAVPTRGLPPQHTGPHSGAPTGAPTGRHARQQTGQYPPNNTGQLPPYQTGPRPPYDTGPRPPYDTGPRPPYDTGPRPPYQGGTPPPYPGPGYGLGGPRRARPPWLWPVVAAVAVAAVVAGIVFIPGLLNGNRKEPVAAPSPQLGAPAEGGTSGSEPPSGGSTDPEAGGGQPPQTDLEPLLLQFTDFAPGGSELNTPPDGDISSVLFCSRTAPQDGKLAEAKRGLAPPFEEGYLVYLHVAAFNPGAAETFMNGLQETTVTCAESSSLDEPRPFDPPPGGEQAVRITATNREVIWVRYRDYVVKVEVSFSSGNDVDDETAPDIATRAIAKVMQGVS